MKYALLLLAFVSFSLSSTASAILYIPPLEERVPSADLIVVGTITLEKTEGGWHWGHVTVARTLKGKAAQDGKIPVRWKAPDPKPKVPALPQLADYTFRPTLDALQIILFFPKKEGEKIPSLNWGSTEPAANEKAVEAALDPRHPR